MHDMTQGYNAKALRLGTRNCVGSASASNGALFDCKTVKSWLASRVSLNFIHTLHLYSVGCNCLPDRLYVLRYFPLSHDSKPRKGKWRC